MCLTYTIKKIIRKVQIKTHERAVLCSSLKENQSLSGVLTTAIA